MPPPTPKHLLGDLAAAFPRQQITAGNVTVYAENLADLPPDVLEQAIRAVIRTSEWFPTIAEIRSRAAEIMLRLPSEPDALAQIEARMTWGRDPEDTRSEDPPPIHPLVREALDRVGGWHAFRSAENAAIIRGQFGKLYRELRASSIRSTQTG